MPTNKNAAICYQTLDKCFRDHRHKYYLEDFIDKCEEAICYYNGIGGVSRRQIFEDTINAQPLTDEEANQLRAVIIILQSFRGLPCNAWVDEVISNLEWCFNLRGNQENVISFEHYFDDVFGLKEGSLSNGR